jgi:hypothetical protein
MKIVYGQCIDELPIAMQDQTSTYLQIFGSCCRCRETHKYKDGDQDRSFTPVLLAQRAPQEGTQNISSDEKTDSEHDDLSTHAKLFLNVG